MADIKVHNVSKIYSFGETEKLALQAVNLDIQSGQFICLLGPSGCGKTTLLNILSGLDKVYEGTLEFSHAHPKMSYMFQESRLLPWLTVQDNLRFVLDNPHSKSSSNKIQHWLKRIGLDGYGRYFPGQLSIGMQQRVAVARALVLEPELLFMDEPFSSLDELTASNMRRELLELWQEQKCTVVFVTHNPLEAVFLADRIMIMTPSPGRIVEEMTLSKSLPRPRNPEDTRLWELSRAAVRKLTGDRHEAALLNL